MTRRPFTLLTPLTGLILLSLFITSPSIQAAGAWTPTGNLNTTRINHTATLLLDGKVLVVGGCNGSGCANNLASVERYDPATGQWTVTGSLTTARQAHTATLLQNGKVLVAGGCAVVDCGSGLASTELYDPITGQWSPSGSLNTPRVGPTATLLSDGRVLVAGGWNGGPTSSAEIYNPTTGQWTPTNNMTTARNIHTATLLPNGKVLVAGGEVSSGNYLSSTELYDPATGQWSVTGSMGSARYKHTAVLMSNGKVLAIAGSQNNGGSYLNSAELYDPATGQWSSTSSMSATRTWHTATLLSNGKVLVAGGCNVFDCINSLASAELYDPGTSQWSSAGTMTIAHRGHTAILLSNGKVLIAGGIGSSGFAIATTELYDPDASPPPTYTISGRVTDSNGNPISGVTITGDTGNTTSTNGSGNYTLGGLLADSHKLTPSKNGYTFSPNTRIVNVPPDGIGKDFIGSLQVALYSISGRVTNNSGNPISGVTLSDGAGHSATTDGNGDYTLNGLTTGAYLISPSKNGYTFSPASRSLNVPPNATGINFTGTGQATTYTISGRVTASNGNPIPGVLISAGSGHSAVTSSNGNYSLSGLTAGSYTLTPSKNGYSFSPASRALNVPPSATGRDFTGATASSAMLRIEDVRPCFKGPFFVAGPPLPNRYDAFVNWSGLSPNRVDFTLNGVTTQKPASGNPVSHSYNMGSNLQYSLFGKRNTLAVRALVHNNTASPSYFLYPIGVAVPTWLPIQPTIRSSDCRVGSVKYGWELLYPSSPFSGNLIPPTWFPFIGGSTVGIKSTVAEVEFEATSDGSGSAKVSGGTGFEVGDQEVEGRVFGKGEGGIEEGRGLQLDLASFGIEIEGTFKKEKPLVDIICKIATGGACPLKEAEGLPIVGSLIKWFNKRAIGKATFQPKIELASSFRSNNLGLKWDSFEGTGRVKITLALVLEAIKNLAAEAYGGGELQSTFQTPANPSYLKQFAAKFFAGTKLKIWKFERKYESWYEWSHKPGGNSILSTTLAQEQTLFTTSNWLPISRDYINNLENYATFRANEPLLQQEGHLITLNNSLNALTTTENPIVTNVFPDGHPVLASDNATLLLWVHDDASKPQMQGEEIFYSLYNGATWSVPAGITNDYLQDFTPQVAFDQNHHAVAVWERNKNVHSAASQLDAAYTNSFELAYAVWNGSIWSAPVYLTANDALDHAPTLVRGNDGQLLLVWRHNTAGELLGTAPQPDTLFYALWDGVAWSTPQVLLNNAVGVLGLTAGRYNANTMSFVYSQETDGDLSTSEDQELYQLAWNGSTLSNAIRLTNDTQPDNSPTFFYDPSGNPRLLWLKNDTLYALLGNLAGTPQPIAVEGSATALDYAATQDQVGNLILLWQGYSPEGVDVFYASYDQSHNVFSMVEQLTYDQPLEKFMAPIFAPSGEMLMAYNKTALIDTTVTVSPTLEIENVTTFGQTDLYVLRHTFGSDLVLDASDLTVTPTNPALGSTAHITAMLRNIGDRAVPNPKVTFYLNDPAIGGTVIGTAIAPLNLIGGMTTTLTLDWSVPTNGGPFAIYVQADPDGVVTELNENNNKAHFLVSAPDLTVDSLLVDYNSQQMITLMATLSNTGVTSAAPFLVTFHLSDPITGPVVAQANVDGLAEGASTDVYTAWDATSVPTGRYLIYAVGDSNDDVIEANETNNNEWASVSLLPDLVLDPTTVITTPLNANSGLAVSIQVLNIGDREANKAMLGLYDQLPEPNVTPLVSTTLTIPAEVSQIATLNLNNFSSAQLYAAVGINGEIEDRDVGNNILLLIRDATGSNNIYLPIILKNR